MATWYRLQNFRCPVSGCKGFDTPSNWYCYNDNSAIYIAQTGYMRCNCQSWGNWDHYGLICNWRFDCGNHGNHPFSRFKAPDFEGFTFALSSAVQLMNSAGATWVGQLCVELGKQYGSDLRPNWHCDNDQSDMYIAQTGYMRCSCHSNGNWDHYGLICNWRFGCGINGDHIFSRLNTPDFESFTFALSVAVQLMNATGAPWVGQLCVELGRQYRQGDRKSYFHTG